jgi:hypothetical protein
MECRLKVQEDLVMEHLGEMELKQDMARPQWTFKVMVIKTNKLQFNNFSPGIMVALRNLISSQTLLEWCLLIP